MMIRAALLLLLLLVSFPALSSQYWAAGAYQFTNDQSVTGVRSRFSVERIGGKSQKAAWMAVRVGNYWVQAGWQNWGGPQVVVMCFDLRTFERGCPGVDFVSSNHPQVTQNTFSEFAVINVAGSTIWQVWVDGVLTSRYDFGETYAYSGQVDIEQSPSDKPERFPVIVFDPAIEFLRAGVWESVSMLRDGRSGGGVWGVNGSLQDSSIPIGALHMGSGIPDVPFNTPL